MINDLQNIPEVVVSDDQLFTKTSEKWIFGDHQVRTKTSEKWLLVAINYAPNKSQKWLLVMINYAARMERHCESFAQKKYFRFERSVQSPNNSSHKVYAGVFRLLFLIGHLYLMGVWLSKDQRTNTIKTHV